LGGDRDWSGAAARGDPEAQFFLGLNLIRTNLTKFVARVPLLSKVPVVGKRFENTSYTIDGSIGPEQLENAYQWIKKSADKGFAPAKESEKLFTGRIPVPNQSGPPSRGQPPQTSSRSQVYSTNTFTDLIRSPIPAGSAPLTYQWRKDDNGIGGTTSATYTINQAQPADSGQYSVVVSNAAGSATSAGAAVLGNPSEFAMQWQQSFGGSSFDYSYSLRQTADGGYIVGGESSSGADGNKSSPNYEPMTIG